MFTRLLSLLIAWVIAFPAYGIDVNGELKKAVLEKQAADPTGYAGRVYYNTGTNAGKIYNGTSWLTIADSASAVTNPMTTLGDIIIGAASGVVTRLGIGSNLQILRSDGTTLAWTDGLATDTASGLVSRELRATHATTFKGNAGGANSASVNIDVSRVGNTVTLVIPQFVAVTPTTSSVSLISNTMLPTWARPATSASSSSTSYNNAGWVESISGLLFVTTTGRIEFLRSIAAPAYTNSVIAGWYFITISYIAD